jgi:hypothetical protein
MNVDCEFSFFDEFEDIYIGGRIFVKKMKT